MPCETNKLYLVCAMLHSYNKCIWYRSLITKLTSEVQLNVSSNNVLGTTVCTMVITEV